MTDDWGAALAYALRLGVTPDAFWRLSAREWLALIRAGTPPSVSRADLKALMARFPDA